MKIIEVRDGFIKLEADESVYLSSFIRAAGMEKDYIAQISSLKKINNVYIAFAKILFIMRDEQLFNYDNTEPSVDSEVTTFTMDILRNSINVSNPLILGKTLDDSCNIVIDSSAFNKKMLISVDDVNMNNLLLSNLTKQFDNLGVNTVIIDTNKVVKLPKFLAGKDFKLPLNKITLQSLYKCCINEATEDSRQMIADVFKDLGEYFDSVPFVPFNVLKSIIDDIVDKQHIFKLFVLKNKLSFLSKLGYFAETKAEADSISKIIESINPVIDISSVDTGFQNYYIEYIYSVLKPEKTQVLFETSNIVSKHNLKMIIKESDISSTLIVHSKYRYLNDIKVMFDNFIIEPTPENKSVFRVYNSFLSSMQENTYLITGEGINYIPVISKAQEINEVVELKQEQPEVQSEEYSVQLEEDVEQPDNNDIIPDDDITSENGVTVENDITQEDEITQEEEITREEDLTPEIEQPTQEEIFANIEQKSEEIIDSISEEAEDIQNIDLFEEDELEEDDSDDVLDDEDEIIEETAEDLPAVEDVIEPEYEEIPSDIDLDNQEEVVELNNSEEIITEPEDAPEEFPLSQDSEILEEIPEQPALDGDIQQIDDLEQELLLPEEESLKEEPEEIKLVDTEEVVLDNYDEITEIQDDLEELSSDADITEDTVEIKDLEDFSAEEEIINDTEEFTELNPDVADDNDIIIDISDEEENINIDEEVDKRIVEDVDKVYTTMKEPDELDNISDSDLDLIDELNSGSEDEVLLEEYTGDILEQPSESIIPEKQPALSEPEILEKRDSNTPIVPVYDADIPQEDMVISDSIQQGDSVVHAKYGNGIVEKMIKYGTKTLYSINFENIGRRLLDPTLTEIKKL